MTWVKGEEKYTSHKKLDHHTVNDQGRLWHISAYSGDTRVGPPLDPSLVTVTEIKVLIRKCSLCSCRSKESAAVAATGI